MLSRLPATVCAQVLLGIVAIAMLALWPPRRGPMLLISLRGAPADVLNAVMAGHAALLGRGPLPGSVVVLGDRARITAAIGGKAVVVMAAPRAICGTLAEGRAAA